MYYGEDEYTDEYFYDEPYREEDDRYWTPRRIVLTVVAILVIVAFLAYFLLPLIQAAQAPDLPPPPVLPSA